jgi:hypothetical protein
MPRRTMGRNSAGRIIEDGNDQEGGNAQDRMEKMEISRKG